MATYYEVIKVQPDASVAEIETALDAQYNHWRRLVTHHQPEIVSQASEMLRALEVIRATLTDQARRSTYDEMIGMASVVGGLADPTLVSSAEAKPAPPPPSTSLTTSNPPIPTPLHEDRGSRDFEQRLVAEETRARKAQAIASSLAQAESHLTAKRYRLVREALAGFDGLGAEGTTTATICQRDDPQWLSAQALVQRADDLPGKLTLQMIPFTTIGYAVVGYFLLALAASVFNVYWLDDDVLRVVIGAALGAAGPALYYWKWGGRTSLVQDRVLAGILPLGLGIVLTIGVVVIVIVVALFLLSLFAGSG